MKRELATTDGDFGEHVQQVCSAQLEIESTRVVNCSLRERSSFIEVSLDEQRSSASLLAVEDRPRVSELARLSLGDLELLACFVDAVEQHQMERESEARRTCRRPCRITVFREICLFVGERERVVEVASAGREVASIAKVVDQVLSAGEARGEFSFPLDHGVGGFGSAAYQCGGALAHGRELEVVGQVGRFEEW